jgi:Membrane-associated lipoprotein involved in thiamine biosynthesis
MNVVLVANDDSSELMIVTHNAGIKPTVVDPELYSLIKIGKKISLDPKNNLNIAIGPLVQTWRIGFDDAKVPSDSEIQTVMKKTDPQKIILNENFNYRFSRRKGMDKLTWDL